MTIGIDLSPLQTGHRMRGVGSVIINFINNLSANDKKNYKFIFYMYSDQETHKAALSLLNLNDLDYEVRDKPLANNTGGYSLPGKLRLISKLLKKTGTMIRFRLGQRGYEYKGVDIYLSTDQTDIMPRMRGVKKAMIAYDLIPYIIEWDYLRTYKSIRQKGLNRKTALAAQLQRHIYITKIRINVKKSNWIIAISNQTKNDFIKYASATRRKIKTVYLGVNAPIATAEMKEPDLNYVESSWGYISKPLAFNNKVPYILYLGGTDARRKIDDLVTAFNHLRAEGYHLKLFLSGDILQGPNNLPVKESRDALYNSSYTDDIVYLGFTDEEVKAWLYEHALAFVYPSKYEGFGLPILEAMSYGTPVITYNNSSIHEIADKSVLYATDANEIKDNIKDILEDHNLWQKYSVLGIKNSSKYTWQQTTKGVVDFLS